MLYKRSKTSAQRTSQYSVRQSPPSRVRKIIFRLTAVTTWLALATLALTNCKSTSSVPTGENLKPPKGVTLPEAKPLMKTAINYRAQFSADGARLIFISRNRPKHTHPQVYEYNIYSHSERRVTFQDGEISDVVYDNKKDFILYASNTDEIKENPVFMQQLTMQKPQPMAGDTGPTTETAVLKPTARFSALIWDEAPPRTEIYESKLDGTQIRRLTDSPQFDGSISVRPQTDEIIFTSMRGKIRQLFLLNTQTRGLTRLGGESKNDDLAHFSSDGKNLLWSHAVADESLKVIEVWIGNNHAKQGKPLIFGQGQNLDASWHPSGEEFVFASNREDENNFEIYVVKTDGSCLRRLTYHSAMERWPVISPDGKRLVFTSSREGLAQLYETEYAPPACPPNVATR